MSHRHLLMTNYSGLMEGSRISEDTEEQCCPDFEGVKGLVTIFL